MGRPRKTTDQKLATYKMNRDKIGMLFKKGWTDQEVADFLGIRRNNFLKWKKDQKFNEEIRSWKDEADEKVERSLYDRALGWRTTFKKNFVVSDGMSGSHVEVHEEELVFAPDTTACIFWLKNRKPNEWTDRKPIDVDDRPPQKLIIQVVNTGGGNGKGHVNIKSFSRIPEES